MADTPRNRASDDEAKKEEKDSKHDKQKPEGKQASPVFEIQDVTDAESVMPLCSRQY